MQSSKRAVTCQLVRSFSRSPLHICIDSICQSTGCDAVACRPRAISAFVAPPWRLMLARQVSMCRELMASCSAASYISSSLAQGCATLPPAIPRAL
jgi:hypothetical protein